MITKEEILHSLSPINKIYFFINDIEEYAEKVLKLAKFLETRNQNNELISYVIYYDNTPTIFISMVWTKPEYRGKGFAKKLISTLIANSQKDISLRVHKNNPALQLYKSLKFLEEAENDSEYSMYYKRCLSIMQPYIFPYIGYFHLIEASNEIIFYDDVNFIMRGWINRNRILLNNQAYLFTVPVAYASQNKLINEISPLINEKFLHKFFLLLESAYKKAPFYKDIISVIKPVFLKQYESFADLAIESIMAVYSYLGKNLHYKKSSLISPETKGLPKEDRLIAITKKLEYKNYVNAQGGKELYNKVYFKQNGVELLFIESEYVSYKQFKEPFVPWLSIIDIMMFNDAKSINDFFSSFRLS